MSVDIREVLRNYATHFEAGLRDFDVQDITAPRAERLDVRPPVRPGRPWLVMATAAVLVVLAIGGVAVLLSGNGSGGEFIDEPTTVTTAPTEPTAAPTSEPPSATSVPPSTTPPSTAAVPSTTVPRPAPILTGESWQLVSDPVMFPEGTSTLGVTEANGALIVGGADFEPWPWEAAIWRSSDGGEIWTRIASDNLGAGEIQSMAASGATIVAVGNEVADLDNDWTEDRHAVWLSTDAGLTWARAPFDEAVFGAGFIWRVAAGGPGFLATGRQCVGPLDSEQAASGLLAGCGVEELVVWTSVDGLTWERRWSEVVPGAGLYDIGHFGSHFIITGSWFASNANFAVAAVWVSEDGSSWTRRELPVAGGSDSRPSVVTGVEVGGPGYVAVGWEGGSVDEPRIWTSADAATWTAVDDLPDLENVTLSTLTRVGTRLVAAGGYLGQVSPIAWWSDDGATWTAAEVEGEGSVWAAAAAGRSVVAIGSSVWISPPID